MRCRRALELSRPAELTVPGAELAIAAAPYRGRPRELVTRLKFRARTGLAETAAELIAARLPPPGPLAVVVPVPAAPARRRVRGFDSAEAIAAALARRLGVGARACLVREDGPRQVGRDRAARIARHAGIRASGPVPPQVVLVDDVATTGSTLAESVAALRAAGSEAVWAAVVCRAIGGLGKAAAEV
ncbi:ComF family protein [Thermoleophilia bacterium SCSIO 60948]|nr:ComF family protein [Thermoleophilia bacterium SCSIO 60948]